MANPSVQLVQSDKIVITGDLTFATIMMIVRSAEQVIQQCDDICYVDLQTVRRSDSAGLGLLIELIRKASQQYHKELHFINVPPQLLKLAKFSGVDGILFEL